MRQNSAWYNLKKKRIFFEIASLIELINNLNQFQQNTQLVQIEKLRIFLKSQFSLILNNFKVSFFKMPHQTIKLINLNLVLKLNHCILN